MALLEDVERRVWRDCRHQRVGLRQTFILCLAIEVAIEEILHRDKPSPSPNPRSKFARLLFFLTS